MFKDFGPYKFDFDAFKHQIKVTDFRPQKDMKISIDASGKEYKFIHTSLYKVDYLVFKREEEHNVGNMWRLHKTQSMDEDLEQGNEQEAQN